MKLLILSKASTVELWKWTSNFIPHFIMDVMTYPFWYLRSSMWAKQAPAVFYDDVIKWKHFPCYWSFVRGIHRLSVNSPHKGQWRRALMSSLICAWINGWVRNRKTGDLRRHRAHYGVSVMQRFQLQRLPGRKPSIVRRWGIRQSASFSRWNPNSMTTSSWDLEASAVRPSTGWRWTPINVSNGNCIKYVEYMCTERQSVHRYVCQCIWWRHQMETFSALLAIF